MKLKHLGRNTAELESGPVTVLFSYGETAAVHVEGFGYVNTNNPKTRATAQHVATWLKAQGAQKPHAASVGIIEAAADGRYNADDLREYFDREGAR